MSTTDKNDNNNDNKVCTTEQNNQKNGELSSNELQTLGEAFVVPDMEPIILWYDETTDGSPSDAKDANLLTTFVSSYGNEFAIKEFCVAFILPDYTIVIYGKRRSGKTYILRLTMFSVHRLFTECVVFTATKEDREYADIVPDSKIILGLDEKVLFAVIEVQRQKVDHLKNANYRELPYEYNINLLLIFDDCLSEGLRYNELLNRLFFNGRHWHIMLIITTQDAKGLPPKLKENTDLCISFRMGQQRSKQAMREAFCDYYKNDQEYDEVSSFVHNNNEHVVEVRSIACPNEDPKDYFFVGKAVPANDLFVMGAKYYWEEDMQQLRTIFKGELGYRIDDLGYDSVFDIVPITYNFKSEPYAIFFDESLQQYFKVLTTYDDFLEDDGLI